MLYTTCPICNQTNVRVFEISDIESKISEHNWDSENLCSGSGEFIANVFVKERKTPKGGSSTAPPKRTTKPARAPVDDGQDESPDEELSAVERLWRAYNRLSGPDQDLIDALMKRLHKKGK